MLPFPTDLQQFVIWLGSPVAVGVLVAYLLEQFSFWHKLEPQHKRLIVFALSVALPPLSQWIQGHATPGMFSQVDTVYQLALQGLFLWLGSQVAHGNNLLREYHGDAGDVEAK